jgi:hypothetical protein
MGGHNRQNGTKRKLIRIAGGFHEERGRILPDEAVIVCDLCDEILPD